MSCRYSHCSQSYLTDRNEPLQRIARKLNYTRSSSESQQPRVHQHVLFNSDAPVLRNRYPRRLGDSERAVMKQGQLQGRNTTLIWHLI